MYLVGSFLIQVWMELVNSCKLGPKQLKILVTLLSMIRINAWGY